MSRIDCARWLDGKCFSRTVVEPYVAQLERVREAAQELLSNIDHDGSDEVADTLRAALAGCSHKSIVAPGGGSV